MEEERQVCNGKDFKLYKWKVGTHGAGTAFINRTEQDSNDSITGRLASTITVMEIKV